MAYEPTVYYFEASCYCPQCARDAHGDLCEFADVGFSPEVDSPQHCAECGELLDCTLTDDGAEYVADALECGDGDPDVLMAWWYEYCDLPALEGIPAPKGA